MATFSADENETSTTNSGRTIYESMLLGIETQDYGTATNAAWNINETRLLQVVLRSYVNDIKDVNVLILKLEAYILYNGIPDKN